MATPNYSYEKRQRELAKKRKAEEKKQKKTVRPGDGQSDSPDTDAPETGTPAEGGATGSPPAA